MSIDKIRYDVGKRKKEIEDMILTGLVHKDQLAEYLGRRNELENVITMLDKAENFDDLGEDFEDS